MRSNTINSRPLVPKLGALAQQEVDIALASMRESVLDLHAAQALELITHSREQVPTRRSLEIYCQLHRLGAHESLMLRTRVLARLGDQTARRMGPSSSAADAAAAEEWDSPWSFLLRMRKRLQGRNNLELRRWIELHSGRTQTKLLQLHVRGALRLIDMLKPQNSYAEVVQLYTDSMHVPPSLSRAVYFMAVGQIVDSAAAPAVVKPVEADETVDRRDPLRIAPLNVRGRHRRSRDGRQG